MKKQWAWILALLLTVALAACGQQKQEQVGGWTLTDTAEISDEARTAFDKALDGLTGVSYTPVALLGTQLVSGTNYCLLCEARVVYPDAQPYYALVYVYQNLQGEAEILNIVALDLGQIVETGEIRNAQPAGEALMGGWYVDRESEASAEDAVLHLGSQVVAGTNHCVLCKGWKLSFIYEDLEGKTEILKEVPLDLGALSQTPEA